MAVGQQQHDHMLTPSTSALHGNLPAVYLSLLLLLFLILQGFFSQVPGDCKVLDFAGGMVVHMLGGLFGLVGAYMCGPRLGRFEMLGQDDYEEESSVSTESCGDTDARGSGGDLADSASELAGTNTPPSDGRPASNHSPRDAAVLSDAQLEIQQQQQQQLQQQELCDSRSLHTLLPPVPAPAGSASSSRGVVVEMGQLGVGKGKQLGAANGSSIAAGRQGGANSSNGGTQLLQQPAAGVTVGAQQHAQQAAGAAGQPAAGGSSRWGSLLGKLGLQRQQQRRRRRHRHHDTSAASCGTGICKFVPKAMPGHDMAFVTLGTFMLWFGWFGFNNGSVYMYVNGNPTPTPGSLAGAISAEVVQRTSMNTALGGAAAGLTSLLCAALFWGEWAGCVKHIYELWKGAQ